MCSTERLRLIALLSQSPSVTVGEAAFILGVHRCRIYELIEHNRLATCNHCGGIRVTLNSCRKILVKRLKARGRAIR